MRTKFHFFIRISIEFPIFDMCFPTFREFIILPTKAYCAVEEVNEVKEIFRFDVVEQVISKHFSLMHTSTN